MDNLTHSLTGLFLSRAGLNRISPHASWILVLAANAPDVDAVSALKGSLFYLHYHRHLTHSLIALPLVALLPVVLVRLAIRKPISWMRAYSIAIVGVASHLALDSTNLYGIRLLLPFSGRWFRLDITSVIDIWIWTVLLLAVVAPLLSRLVGGEIGSTAAAPGRSFAVFALCFLLLYNFARALLHERAVSVLDSRLYENTAPLRVAAFPGPANPFAWSGVVETASSFSLHKVNLLDDFDPASGRVFYKPEPSPALEAANQTETFREFLRFSQYPFWRVTPLAEPEDARRVEVMDLRFGSPVEPGFVATAILDSQLRVLRSWFQFGVRSPK